MKIRIGRLRKLANHLLKGNLGHEVFNFTVYNSGATINKTTNCRTAGCAMGECPIVFPKVFFFTTEGYVRLIEHPIYSLDEAADKFFGLNDEQYNHLFIPLLQNASWGKTLHGTATKDDVANNIIAFCKLVQANKL